MKHQIVGGGNRIGQILDGGGVNVLVRQRRGIDIALGGGENVLGQVEFGGDFLADGPLGARGSLRRGRRCWSGSWIAHDVFVCD